MAGFSDITVNVAEGDRPAERRREGGAGDAADFVTIREQQLAGIRHALTFQHKSHQLANHSALPAADHTNDHLLPDIAALGKANRSIFDTGLERNRVGIHVDAKERTAGLNAERFSDRGVEPHGASPLQCLSELSTNRAVDVISSHSKPIVLDHDHFGLRHREGSILIFDPPRELRPNHRRFARDSVDSRSDRFGGGGANHSDWLEPLARIFDADVLHKNQLFQTRGERCRGRCWHIKQDPPAELEHAHVSNHSALWRQPRGITASTRRELLYVVGQQTLQPGRTVGTMDENRSANEPADHPNRAVSNLILVHFWYAETMRWPLFRYSSACLLTFVIASSAAAQPVTVAPGTPATGDASFRVFLGGAAIGTTNVSLARAEDGWLIRGSGRLGAPVDLVVGRIEVRYDETWKPRDMSMDLSSSGESVSVKSVFDVGSVRTEVLRKGQTTNGSSTVARDTIVLPNLAFSAYEALAVRLSTASPGSELRAYIAPQAEIGIHVDSVSDEMIQTTERRIPIRRWRITFMNPGGSLPADVWIEGARLVRLDIPSQSITVVREDVASVGSRIVSVTRANDQQIFVPASGFNLAATISKPAPAAGRLPAVILVAGSGPADRDETVAGIPIFGQLADALANAGFLVVRYDKRGVGQSGGRLETATLTDFADDALAVVRFLRKRKDVDSNRIAVFGHSEGASVSLIAASREKRVAALILGGAVATKGVDLILEQQRHILEQSDMPQADRQKATELQKNILNAVITGRGWEQIPADLRRQVDTPWYHSLLAFDPLPLFRKVQQPLLIVHGELDRQVPIHHADELAQLARTRTKAGATDYMRLPALNHLFVPAVTGEVSEYAALKEHAISPQLASVVIDWLRKTLPATPARRP